MQKTSETLKKRGFKIARGGVLSCILAAVMTMYLPAMAFAGNYDIDEGSVDIHAYEDRTEVTHKNETHTDSTPTVTSTSGNVTQNTVTITAENNATANVTLSGVNINTRENPTNENSSGAAAITVSGAGSVNIELEGNNSLTSGSTHAGIEDHLTGTLTINDADNDGTLSATGGRFGAGIGGGNVDGSYMGEKITINGGTVTAKGGYRAAGIGGVAAGKDIMISGGSVTAIGGDLGAGIGGGMSNRGRDITISGGSVIAIGGLQAAGIGGGSGHDGRGHDITITQDADVSVSGGTARGSCGSGAAIGNGGSSDGGNPVPGAWGDPDTDGLYTTGSIKIYAPGTTAALIAAGTAGQPEVTTGTIQDPNAQQNQDPENQDPENQDPENQDPENQDPENPGLQPGPAVAAIVAANDSYAPATATTAEDVDAAFYAAVDMQVEELLKEINALIAEGKLNEANALIAKGLKINAGTHKGFNASTLAKLGEASRMGIAVTVNFVYAGTSYSVTIPGHSVIDPVSLVDQNGYCGFLNLVKYYG